MYCMNCGFQYDESMGACPQCNYPNPGMNNMNNMYGVNSMNNMNNMYGMNSMNNMNGWNGIQQQVPVLSKKEFCKLPQMKQWDRSITCCCIAIYVLSAIALMIGLFYLERMGVFVDFGIILASGIWMQTTKGKGGAIMLLVYSIVNVLVFLMVYGRFGGYLYIIVGVIAMRATYKLDQAYNSYLSSRTRLYG